MSSEALSFSCTYSILTTVKASESPEHDTDLKQTAHSLTKHTRFKKKNKGKTQSSDSFCGWFLTCSFVFSRCTAGISPFGFFVKPTTMRKRQGGMDDVDRSSG